MSGKSWNADLRAGSVADLKAMVATEDAIPGAVRVVIEAAIDALPERTDLGVMVNTSG